MTPEGYIFQQCDLFENDLKNGGIVESFGYKEDEISKLDDYRSLVFPDGTEELSNEIAIRWGAAFTRIIAESYVSQWQVDAESRLPVVVVKCGGRGMQIKSIVYAAKTFKDGGKFTEVWHDLIKTLKEAGAEKA